MSRHSKNRKKEGSFKLSFSEKIKKSISGILPHRRERWVPAPRRTLEELELDGTGQSREQDRESLQEERPLRTTSESFGEKLNDERFLRRKRFVEKVAELRAEEEYKRAQAEKNARIEAAKREASDPRSLFIKVLYLFFCLCLLGGSLWLYYCWYRHGQEESIPPMVMPIPYVFEHEQPVQAALLWKEIPVKSPVAGTIQLARGTGRASVVSRNDVLGTVLTHGRTRTLKSPGRGYFVPGTDGAETSWSYSSIWLGSDLLPEPPEFHWTEDLNQLPADRIIGKLIVQPQNPRAVIYVNLNDSLKASLKKGVLWLRSAPHAPKWKAEVRVFVPLGERRAKVCIDMPCFPLEFALSRTVSIYVCSDEEPGVVVPESAVVIRNGSYGVYELIGDRLTFRRVRGRTALDGKFFIASGLSSGNPVALYAEESEEKRIRLW